MFRNAFGLPPVALEENWFLSDIFFESVAECTDERLGCAISNNLITAIRRNPARFLYDFWVNESDERRPGVSRFSAGSEQLRLRIENRRSLHQAEPLPMRRKIYSALLLIDEIELILGFARKAGIPLTTVGELGKSTARRIVIDVPVYYIERELALRLEKQNRPIEENDFRDMQSFCTVIPYADEIIAENQFASLAKQAKLDQKYHTRITTNIFGLMQTLE